MIPGRRVGRGGRDRPGVRGHPATSGARSEGVIPEVSQVLVGFAAAAGAIALFAPAALSNDDRGYGRTALITTPVVGAGFAVAPGMWKGLRGAGQDLKGRSEERRVGKECR